MDDEIFKRREKTASERYREDARFNAIVQSIVSRVMKERGPVDPERADRDAYEIAIRVAAMVLETIFQEDAELNAQRELAERYKKIAEDALMFAPPPMFIRSEKPE